MVEFENVEQRKETDHSNMGSARFFCFDTGPKKGQKVDVRTAAWKIPIQVK